MLLAAGSLEVASVQPREIARRAVEFDHPARMCMDLWGGVSDLRTLPMSKPEAWKEPAPGVDEWGCTWVKTEVDNMGQVKGHPLADLCRVGEHSWPDPDDASRYRGFSKALDDPAAQDAFLGAGFSNGLFERTWMLHGFQATLEDFLLRPDQMLELVNRVADVHVGACRAIHEHSGARADWYMLWDDLGSERAPFFSMDVWRQFYYPAYDRLISAARELGVKVLLHSDGYMPEILDDFCELGLGWINIQQPLLWGIDFLAERFKGRIALNMFPDTQHLMPKGDRDEIRAHVRELVEKLDSPQGGFVAGVYPPNVGGGATEAATRVAVEAFQELQHLHHEGNL